MKARMAQQPAFDRGSFVGAVIVENQMHLKSDRHCSVNGFKEAAKLDRAMAPMKLADHGPGLNIERGEQVDGAVSA